MFFKKKTVSEEPEHIPVDEARRLSQSGLSDREIIKKLKAEGYSYSEIEKAMLRAVKEGVSSQPVEEVVPQPPQPQAPPQAFYSSEFPNTPEPLTESVPEVEEPPETLIEEVIENIVNEKWEKFSSEKVREIEEEIQKAKEELEQIKKSISNKKPAEDYSSRMQEISNEIEDLQSRVGALEKAFKQFLPTLMNNIENLSKLVDEMKKKHKL